MVHRSNMVFQNILFIDDKKRPYIEKNINKTIYRLIKNRRKDLE